jgi:hypothetical protein
MTRSAGFGGRTTSRTLTAIYTYVYAEPYIQARVRWCSARRSGSCIAAAPSHMLACVPYIQGSERKGAAANGHGGGGGAGDGGDGGASAAAAAGELPGGMEMHERSGAAAVLTAQASVPAAAAAKAPGEAMAMATVAVVQSLDLGAVAAMLRRAISTATGAPRPAV